MITTGVLIVQDASSNSITALQDRISTEIPKVLGRWSFDLKIFRANPHTIQASGDEGFMYDLSVDYEPKKSVTLVNKTAILTTTEVPNELLESGCTNGSLDPLDSILQTKMQSLWTLRQSLRGENGNGYELRGGEFVVRAVNVFLHGNFKNFVVVIEHHTKSKSKSARAMALKKIEQLCQDLEMPKGRLCTRTLGDEEEYLSNLVTQMVEALQG